MAAALILAVLLTAAPSLALAGPRVAVLAFKGPKADKFQADVAKLVGKSYKLVPLEDWDAAAEELGAEKVTEKNVAKVAKQLGVSAVIVGTVEKRRDDYIIRLKVRDGGTGEFFGNPIDVKADGPRLDGSAQRQLKQELFDSIDALQGDIDDNEEVAGPRGNSGFHHGGDRGGSRTHDRNPPPGDDDGDEEGDDGDDDKGDSHASKPPKGKDKDKGKGKGKHHDDDEGDDEDKGDTHASKPDDHDDDDGDEHDDHKDDREHAGSARSHHDDDDGDDDSQRVHHRRHDDDDADEPLDPKAWETTATERAVEIAAGVSIAARRMSFTYSADLLAPPPGYQGGAAPGAFLQADVFPLAVGHKNRSFTRNLGLTMLFDRVVLLSTKVADTMGTKNLGTTQQRMAIGAKVRLPLGKLALAASVSYEHMSFRVDGSDAPSGVELVPNVVYRFVEPALSVKFPVSRKLILDLDVGTFLMLNTGGIQNDDQYGAAKITAVDGQAGFDYLITPKVFARALFRFATIGYDFKGLGMQTTARDTDPDQDVFGARDNYIGGAATIGFLF